MVTPKRSRRNLDLTLASTLAVAACLLVLVEDQLPGARLVLGLALSTILPGYALMALIFPLPSLGRCETIAYSLGLGLALGALSGFLLDRLPSGLGPGPWALWLCSVTLVSAWFACKRRSRAGATRVPDSPSLRMDRRQAMLLALAGTVVLAAIVTAVWGAHFQPRPRFTQFWMLPAENAQQPSLRIGLCNYEQAPQAYRVDVAASGERVQVIHLGLDPNERFEAILSLDELSSEGASLDRVTAVLYRADEPGQPYRHLVWWP